MRNGGGARQANVYGEITLVKHFVVYYEKFKMDVSKMSSKALSQLPRSFCSGSLISTQHILR